MNPEDTLTRLRDLTTQLQAANDQAERIYLERRVLIAQAAKSRIPSGDICKACDVRPHTVAMIARYPVPNPSHARRAA